MKRKIIKIFRLLFKEIKFKYLLRGSIVVIKKGGQFTIGNGVKIRSSIIYLAPNSELEIKDK